ncbi:hypothetical protein TVAG_098220 [Trichomonas vaginalis G3]|uniref:Uncharacterized protein n=1 Tax=Trichomonas vaginalis (strain ATCC PRA-98 / G3) TaxID=412133 RepID=A2ECA2_TRIV3|nr:hypothetical protein TVAGG3_0390340 [Trichomonas vaginalis G3]EAY09686.1 hypothetical protein TVAG_098220 [Trichomonas vaginalis G3]KAI5533943.1 hypothetical protein TVAGG3_0390340 [Trichomonas vaginalis G3]|eukprot:XP_001321909.1 hypothetical protein [Trichomonas vaginalis G3]
MHSINKFREYPEYHDMVTSVNDLLSTNAKVLKTLDSAYNTAFVTYIKNLPAEQKPWNSDLLPFNLKILETYKEEQEKMEFSPNDLQIFLTQLQELTRFQKNALAVDKKMRASKENENKIKANMNAAKAKGDAVKAEQLLMRLNEAKTTTDSLKAEAQELRRVYIEHSDKYKIEFPAQLSTMIVSICNSGIKNLNTRTELATELLNAAQNSFYFEDSELTKLKEELAELEQLTNTTE